MGLCCSERPRATLPAEISQRGIFPKHHVRETLKKPNFLLQYHKTKNKNMKQTKATYRVFVYHNKSHFNLIY